MKVLWVKEELLELEKIKKFFARSDKEQFEYTGLERTDGLGNHGYRGLGEELAAKETYGFSRKYGYNPFETTDIFDSLDDIVRDYTDQEFDAILRITHYPKIKMNIYGNASEGEGDQIYRLCSHEDYGILSLYYEYVSDSGFQIFKDGAWENSGSCVLSKGMRHRVIYTDPLKERWSVTYHVDYKDCKIPMGIRLGIK
jgi:hypothetical protein